LADSSVRYPAGIAEDVLVKIGDYFVLVDFMVLDMEFTKESPLIFGKPFLSTAGAHIDVGAEVICFNINRKEKFEFWPRQQEDYKMIRIKYGPNQQGIREVEIQPHIIFSRSQGMQKKAAPKKGRKGNHGNGAHISQKKDKTAKQPMWVLKEPKKKETPVLTPPSTDIPSSSKQ
jgi:hypothetical protein